MKKEFWKDIKGYEGLYQINNYGSVYSLIKGIILKPRISHNGYYRIGLTKDKKQTSYFVHRLVYEAFNGSVPEGMQVNHINEVKTDNRPENLNLMTPKENSNWGTGKWRGGKKRKKHITQYLIDGTPFFSYFSSIDAEIDTGISNSNINACCKGIRKTAGGFMWKYA